MADLPAPVNTVDVVLCSLCGGSGVVSGLIKCPRCLGKRVLKQITHVKWVRLEE